MKSRRVHLRPSVSASPIAFALLASLSFACVSAHAAPPVSLAQVSPPVSTLPTPRFPALVAPQLPADADSEPDDVPVPVSLENPDALARFFARLADLESGRAVADVRIVQFGDSHTQPDLETATVRRALQARFGDGGRGFVPLLLPAKAWLQSGVQAGVPREWSIARMKMSRRNKRDKREKPHLTGDGFYGLGGVSAVATSPGGRLWLDVPATSHLEIAYLEQPRGGAFDVFIDGAHAARVPTFRKTVASAYRSFDLSDGPHRIELESRGGGESRVFGVGLDRGAVGVTLDALGIGGSRASGILDWNEAHFAEQLRHRAPDLVVFAYGTNEAGYDVDIPVYEKQLTEVIARVARAAPDSVCLLLGPPDWVQNGPDGAVTPPKLLAVIEAQERVAEASGCARFDQLEVMGGAGSMEEWATADPPLGRADRVHMTRAGYERLGAAFASAILEAYDAWRAATPQVSPPPSPATPAPPVSAPPGLPPLPVAKGPAAPERGGDRALVAVEPRTLP
jgi:lysophospholipase L1-like esterase